MSLRAVPSRRIAVSTALLLLALGLAGCHRAHNADVAATVNGRPILKSEVDSAYQAQLGENQGQQPSYDQGELLRLNVLRGLIDEEIVEQRAAKMNLTATPEEVDARVAEMKAPYTEEQFQARLRASKHTLEDVKHDLRRSITINKLLNKEINSKITVTDADVANYYNSHKAEYNLIETQYRLQQIEVTDIPSAQPGNLQGSKATNDVEAKKKIQAIKNRLDSGEDFGALAMNFSERPETASNGGDMGFVPESQLRTDPQVYAAVAPLKAGGVTDILPLLDAQTKKPVGYAIYKLIAREPAGQRDLTDPAVQQAIRSQLRDGRSELLKNAYLQVLRDQARVENFFAQEVLANDAH